MEIPKNTINLAGRGIVYNELADRQYGSLRIDDVIELLHKKKDTFTHLNLSNNILSDEAMGSLVTELKNHLFLEEIDLSHNLITEYGFQQLKPLLLLPNLRVLKIRKNYGPCDQTIEKLRQEMIRCHNINIDCNRPPKNNNKKLLPVSGKDLFMREKITELKNIWQNLPKDEKNKWEQRLFVINSDYAETSKKIYIWT